MRESRGLLKDKICLITGTSQGIGRSIVERFAQEGAVVYANARLQGCLDEWAKQLNEDVQGTVIPIYFDVTDSVAIKQEILKVKKKYGRMDVLVNNAGMVTNEKLGMIMKDKTREMFEINVFGLLELSQLISTRFMVKQKSGSIINMASLVGLEGSSGQVAYSASKGAVIAITKSMAKELAENNVRVNAIAPGMIGTDRLQNTIKDVYKGNVPEIGMGRLGTVDEIADACLYFASELSTYTTGQILAVAGSMVL